MLLPQKYPRIAIILLVVLFSLGFVRTSERNFEIAKSLDIFADVYKEINEHYADEVDPTRLMHVAIDSLLYTLDPYTNFYSESKIEDAKLIQTGQYSGIGISIARKNGKVLISKIEEDSPAAKSDLKVGDEIVRIDRERVANSEQNLRQIDGLIRGEQGSIVKLEINRKGETQPLQKEVLRSYVDALQKDVPYFGMANDKIGFVVLSVFNGAAGREVEGALKKLRTDHPDMEGVILDLRGNPGGRVDQALQIVNLFVEKGEKIVEMKGNAPENRRSFSTNRNVWDREIPLAILLDKGSASASEIVAGAIQDLDRGVIVGQKSFGKGLVQNVRPLSFNTQFKITIAKYYTPSGRCIQAIDYFDENKASGEANSFKTRNGRTVFEGGGIDPDHLVSLAPDPAVLRELKDQGIIFEYVNEFVAEHDSIDLPAAFEVNNDIFNDFLSFVEKGDFEFDTRSENNLEAFSALLETSKKAKAELERLEASLKALKEKDLVRYKALIQTELERTIVERYYFQKGLYERGFQKDPDVLQAIDILEDQDKYAKLLKPS